MGLSTPSKEANKDCNFNRAYCEANRDAPPREGLLNIAVMTEELDHPLALVQLGVCGCGLMMTS